MAKWERLARKTKAPSHLPPPEVCTIVKYKSSDSKKLVLKPGRHFLDMPLDEYGRPDIATAVTTVASTIDNTYQWPAPTNIHHLAYDRADYYNAGDLAIGYRESSSLMVAVSAQLHSLLHEVYKNPPMPPEEVMRQHVDEQRRVTTLFTIGQRAVRFNKWSRIAERPSSRLLYQRMGETATFYRRLSEIESDAFYRYLDTCDDGVLGVMPDTELLATMPLREAVTMLGEVGGARFLDRRRMVQNAVQEYGYDSSVAA